MTNPKPAFVVIALLIGLTTSWSLSERWRTTSTNSQAAPVTPSDARTRIGVDHAIPAIEPSVSRRTRTGSTNPKATSPADSAQTRSPHDPTALARQALATLEELKQLDRSEESTFFRMAMAPLERLRALHLEAAQTGAVGSEGELLAEEIEGWVRQDELASRTRAAVLVAVAPQLDRDGLSRLLLDLTQSPWPDHHVLRGAFIATSLAGSTEVCREANLRLEPLYKLQQEGHGVSTHSFPVTLRGVPSIDHAEIIYSWLAAQETGRPDESLRSQPGLWQAKANLHASFEIGYCVWALQAPGAPLIADLVVQDGSADLVTGDVFRLRAASYSAHALMPCSPYLFDYATRLSRLDRPAERAFAEKMADATAIGVSGFRAAKIESLRYSTSPNDQAELVRELLHIGESLATLRAEDDVERIQDSCQLLFALSADARVEGTVRAAALQAVFASEDWPSITTGIERTLRSDPPLLVLAVSLTSFLDHVQQHPESQESASSFLTLLASDPALVKLRPTLDEYLGLITP